jgi:hypothetical protein
MLPLANKGKFENSELYATNVAEEVADLLIDAFYHAIRDQPRMFVPR